MIAKFNALTARERAMVGLAIVLAVLAIIYLAVYMPLSNARQTALQNAEAATADYKLTMAAAPPSAGSQTASLPPFSRDILLQTSSQFSLPIQRVQTGTNGSLTVWFENVPAQNLLGWMDALKAASAVRFSAVNIETSQDGQVSARLTLDLAGGP